MSVDWTPDKDLPELTGKIFVVTGTSSGGIGREIIKHLALAGAKVYATARSESKSTATIEGILKEHPSIKEGLLIPLMVDFESPESVQDAVTELKKKESKLDVMINNAGGLGTKLELTAAGWEKQMASNYLGHFIFVNGLMPLLRAGVASGSDVRIISVGSNAVAAILGKSFRVDFSNRRVYRGEHPQRSLAFRALDSLLLAGDATRYGISKLAVMMFAAELQKRFNEENLPILSVSTHPGAADSHGRAPSMLKPGLRPLMKWLTVTPEKASWNALFFGTAKGARDEKYKGKYHEPVAVITEAHPYLRDVKMRKVLWDATTDEVNTYLKSKGRPQLGPW